MPLRRRAAAVALLYALAAAPAGATADGPDFYRVADVPAGQELTIRAGPDEHAPALAGIPADAEGIANFGCLGGLDLAAWQAASEAERAAAAKTRWCRVGYDRTIGWAPGWQLAEGSDTGAFRGGARLRSLDGSEWQLRDFAGEPAAAEAWIGFKDGSAAGQGGCNRFTGGYTEAPGELAFGPLASTRMACPEPMMRTESDFFAALDATRQAVATHLLLALFDADGRLLATLTRRDAD